MPESLASVEWLDATVGLITGVLLVLLTLWLGRKHRTLRYTYSSQSLIKRTSDWAERKVKVMVDESLVDPNVVPAEGHDRVYAEVDEVYGSTVRLRNAGNEVAEDFALDIKLGGSAKIIEWFTDPETDEAYPLELDNRGDQARLQVPYLNPKTDLSLDLVYVGEADGQPVITAVGKGVRLRKPPPEPVMAIGAVLIMLMVIIGPFAVVSVIGLPPWVGLLILVGIVSAIFYFDKNQRKPMWE